MSALMLRTAIHVELDRRGGPVSLEEVARRGQVILGRRLLRENRAARAAGRRPRPWTAHQASLVRAALEADDRA